MIIHHDFTPSGASRFLEKRSGFTRIRETLLVGFDLATTLSPEFLNQPQFTHLGMASVLNMKPGEFHELQASRIVSPLISGRYDALDLARKLDSVGFQGEFRTISSTLPDTALVCREIALSYPGVDFDILGTAAPVSAGTILRLLAQHF